MNKQTNNIMLGCWGIGGSLDLFADYQLFIKDGPFSGLSIPSSTQYSPSRIASSKRLPPLSRKSNDGIDFMPFILYDNVTIDEIAFKNLLNPPKRGLFNNWEPSKESKNILEKLALDNIVQIEDYNSHLDSYEIKNLIDETIISDLSDPNIVIPAEKSLSLWIQFHKNLFKMSDSELTDFYEMKESLFHNDNKNVFGLVYECISDINRILILSQKLNQPIYDWEDYIMYYNYKFQNTGKLPISISKSDKLKQLFKVFIPNFEIRSYEQLKEIRQDDRLDSVRSLINENNDLTINAEFIIKSLKDVIKIKNKIESYSMYVGLSGYALSILPGIIGIAIQQIGNSIIKSNLEKTIKWQMFFVEQAEYQKKYLENNIRAIESKTSGNSK